MSNLDVSSKLLDVFSDLKDGDELYVDSFFESNDITPRFSVKTLPEDNSSSIYIDDCYNRREDWPESLKTSSFKSEEHDEWVDSARTTFKSEEASTCASVGTPGSPRHLKRSRDGWGPFQLHLGSGNMPAEECEGNTAQPSWGDIEWDEVSLETPRRVPHAQWPQGACTPPQAWRREPMVVLPHHTLPQPGSVATPAIAQGWPSCHLSDSATTNPNASGMTQNSRTRVPEVTQWQPLQQVHSDATPRKQASPASSDVGASKTKHGQEKGLAEMVAVTTLMVLNVPRYVSLQAFQAALEKSGFGSSFNFLHTPRSMQTGASLGYSFINFVNVAEAERFRAEWHLSSHFRSSDRLRVKTANVQGFKACEQMVLKKKMERKQNSAFRAILIPPR